MSNQSQSVSSMPSSSLSSPTKPSANTSSKLWYTITETLKDACTSESKLSWLSVAVPWLLFIIIVGLLVTKVIMPIDIAILKGVHLLHSTTMDPIMVTITQTANPYVVLFLAAAIICICWLKNYRPQAIFLTLVMGAATATGLLLKLLVHRPRPELWTHLVHETDFSFPSGHATVTMALALTMIFLAWPTKWRWSITILSIILVVIVGLTRLYVGVHYPFDVIAGWLLSAGWVCLIRLLLKHFPAS